MKAPAFILSLTTGNKIPDYLLYSKQSTST